MTLGRIVSALLVLFVIAIDVAFFSLGSSLNQNIFVAMGVGFFNVYGVHLALWWARTGSPRSY